MNRQFVPNFEILLKIDIKNKSGFQSTEYISHGDCFITYTGNFLIVEQLTTSDNKAHKLYIPYNLDYIQTFRYSNPIN